MGYHLRFFDPEAIYFITNRTIEERLFLRPDAECTALVQTHLTQAAQIYGVEIYSAVFMSNHFHLIVSCRTNEIPEFMRYFQSNLARAVNKLRGRQGRFWADRYACEPILDTEALLNKVEYVIMNPVRAKCVQHPLDWPGYITWVDFAGWDPEDPPPLIRLPIWTELTPGEVRREVVSRVHEALSEYALEAFLGVERVLTSDWNSRPVNPKLGGPRPRCHATDISTWVRYVRFHDARTIEHREASIALSMGECLPFPDGMRPPGRRRRPEPRLRGRSKMPRRWKLARGWKKKCG